MQTLKNENYFVSCLKGAKHENFGSEFLTLSKPILVGGLRTGKKLFGAHTEHALKNKIMKIWPQKKH